MSVLRTNGPLFFFFFITGACKTRGKGSMHAFVTDDMSHMSNNVQVTPLIEQARLRHRKSYVPNLQGIQESAHRLYVLHTMVRSDRSDFVIFLNASSFTIRQMTNTVSFFVSLSILFVDVPIKY